MEEEKTTEETFGRKLQQTFKSTHHTGLVSTVLCFQDVRCTGVFVCPGICHMFGVFRIPQSSVLKADYRSCKVFNINRCQNNGLPDVNGYCSCTRGYGGPTCEHVVHYSCYNEWRQIYSSETSSSLDQLTKVARNRSKFKIKYKINDTNIHTVNKFAFDKNMTWSHSVSQLSRDSWNSFLVNFTRIFTIIMDGKYQTEIESDLLGQFKKESTSMINVSWFGKDFTDGSPCFTNDDDGVIQLGNIDELRSKIDGGSAMTFFSYIYVQPDGEDVAGENLNELSQYFTYSYATSIKPQYWYLVKYTTTGFWYILRWMISDGSFVSNVTRRRDFAWCTDDCWLKVFKANQLGQELDGSTTQLAQALRSGHQLRVKIADMAANTKAVYIYGQTVTACLEDVMEPLGVTQFDRSGTAQRKMVSSNGLIKTRRYTLETDTVVEDLEERRTIDWFVDSREWIHVLSVKSGGQIVSGSVAHLRDGLLKGASVRIVVDYVYGMSEIVEADHLELSRNGHVAADVINHVNIQYEGDDDITFAPASSHHLWSGVITTEGDYRRYNYTYKRGGSRQESVSSIVERFIWLIQE